MRLIRFYLALIVVLCGAILAIHVIGGLFPNPIAVLFTNPDGSLCQMPCLFGVRPGKMTLEESLKILDKHPLTHGMQTWDAHESSSDLLSKEAFIQIFSKDGKHVSQVYLATNTCNECSTSISTYQLGLVLDRVIPGNQVLYFSPLPPDWYSDLSEVQPLTDKHSCFVGGSVCFTNSQLDGPGPWQYVPFNSLEALTTGSSN